MPYVLIFNTEQAGKTVAIKDESIVIGRDKADTIYINDPSSSRQHAEIFRIGELYFIRDLDSKNGTFLNEEKITEQALQVGDKIRIGATVFEFKDDSEPRQAQQMEQKVQYAVDDRPPSSTIEIDFGRSLANEGMAGDDSTLQLLYKISKLIGTTHGVANIYEKILKLVLQAVDADNGYIFESTEQGGMKPVMVVEKDSDKTAKVSKSIIKSVLDHQKALMTHDAAMDPRFQASKSIIMRKTSGVICAPLLALDELVGVMYLSVSRVGVPFESKDLELASVIAIQLGMVIQSVSSQRKEKESLMNTVPTLVSVIERRYPKRKGHYERVARYSCAIGEEMGQSGEALFQLRLAALLYDLGRLAAPDDLDTKFSLSAEDDPAAPADMLRKRATERARLASELAHKMHLAEAVTHGITQHAETFDGKGVPDSLLGPDIADFARIISVARAFDYLLNFGGPQHEPQIGRAHV